MINQFVYQSPVGNILIKEESNELTQITFSNNKNIKNSESKLIQVCIKQLEEYFAGKRKVFDLPLKQKGTDFQQRVWKNISTIPYGVTKTYKEIAVQLNNLGAIRAVGVANGANLFHIVIPCHRVIGSDGTLTGYAGGLEVKQKLLELEGVIFNNQISLF